MKRAIGALNPKLDGFDASCFDGVYVTGDVNADDFARDQRSARRPRKTRSRKTRRGSRCQRRRRPERHDPKKKELPPTGLHRDTLAVRAGTATRASGARTPRRCFSPAASCSPTRETAAQRFANEEEATSTRASPTRR